MLKTFFLVTVLTAGPAMASAMTAADHLHQTCAYFEKRTFGDATSERNTWLSMLSHSCQRALRGMTQAGPSADADLEFLELLSELRATIIHMNIARFRERQTEPSHRILRTVTPSGEYLIAKQLGVIAAYRSWVDTHGVETAGAQP